MAASDSSRQTILPFVLLAAAVLLSFGRAVEAPFHFDDHAIAVDPAVTSASGWLDVWRPGQTRPLTYFTFWLNHRVGALNPAGYHAVNLAIHLAACVLVLLCLRRLLPPRAALVAAFLFALHPVQTEPVVYVFARSTLLAACLAFAALLAWLNGRRWGAAGWFAAALLAKEEVAAFPVFLVLLEWARRGQLGAEFGRPIAAMLGLAIAAVGRVAWVAAANPGSGAGASSGVSPVDYLLSQGYSLLRYLQLAAIPVGFTVDPDIPILRDWRGVLAWVTVAALIAVAWRGVRQMRAGFWFIAGLILIAPTSSIFPAADLAADRRMYLPMLAFSAAAGRIVERTAYPLLLAAGGIVLGMLSFARTDVWLNETRLWEDAMQWAPAKARPRVQLARVSPPPQALEYLLEAKRIASDDALVASELGRVFLERGSASEALAEFGRAVALKPRDPLALNNRGVALSMLGMKEHAITDFREALRLDPCLTDARRNLMLAGVVTPMPDGCRLSDAERRELGGR